MTHQSVALRVAALDGRRTVFPCRCRACAFWAADVVAGGHRSLRGGRAVGGARQQVANVARIRVLEVDGQCLARQNGAQPARTVTRSGP